MKIFDILIYGDDISGLSLACGLADDFVIGLIRPVHITESLGNIFVSNSIVMDMTFINIASKLFFKNIQVWDDILLHHVTPCYGMEIKEKDTFNSVMLESICLGYSEIGYIVSNTVIQQALLQVLSKKSNVTFINVTRLQNIVWGKNEAFVTLEDGSILSTKLIIAADGINSHLRISAGIPLTFWGYEKHVISFVVQTEYPHENIIRKIFYDEGMLTLFPLGDEHSCFVVWLLPTNLAVDFLYISIKDFNIKFMISCGLVLGKCIIQGKLQFFSVQVNYARNFGIDRLLLLGDSAYFVYPMFVQGINLHLADVISLLQLIRRLNNKTKDIGYYPYFRSYERNSKYNAATSIAYNHLSHIFLYDKNFLNQFIKSSFIKTINFLPNIKLELIKYIMGLKHIKHL